ncbi:MAG: RsmD family RNA methyltransferase [Candidatus Bathyarchaeota archaeon]|nr:RsmD family RNA methyltransferase [Candidatus Bathyarchaeota archaeon]
MVVRSLYSSRWRLPKKFFQGPSYVGESGVLVEEVDRDKVDLRMQVYLQFPRKTVLDLFAGKGCLAYLYVKYGCERLICVEKDKRFFQVLRENLGKFKGKCEIEFFNMDNIEFLEKNLSPSEPVSHVDFDAFGSPSEQVKKFFQVYRLKTFLLCFLTDGFILNFRRLSNINLKKHYLQDFSVKHGEFKSVQHLGEYCQKIQENFMNILAMSYNLQTYPVYFKVNLRCTATYSCYLFMPKIVGNVDFKRYVGLKTLEKLCE